MCKIKCMMFKQFLHTINKKIVNQNYPKKWIIKKQVMNKQTFKFFLKKFHLQVWLEEVEFGKHISPTPTKT